MKTNNVSLVQILSEAKKKGKGLFPLPVQMYLIHFINFLVTMLKELIPATFYCITLCLFLRLSYLSAFHRDRTLHRMHRRFSVQSARH